jgi:ribosomal protein S18 acetylase RimI-like enzyme
MQAGPRVSVRPAQASDAPFLARLYAATRDDVLQLPVPRAVADGIIRHQQQLQAQDYAARYPAACHLLLECGEVALGRLVLNRAEGEIRVVDLAIAPEARRRGHARALLHALQQQAGEDGCVLTLRVRRDNRAAYALYAAMGFELAGGDQAAAEMRWLPARPPAAQNE